jgi:predicted DNA-binding transcriptional regulator YafY
MAKFKPQYRRLLFIDDRLRSGRYPNCSDLAAEWEVSPKTIQRDMDYLKYDLNAPIVYDAARHGYAYSEAQYRLPAIPISDSDLFAVCIAERALRQFENTPLHGRLASVFARLQGSLPDKAAVDPAWIGERIVFHPMPPARIEPETWDTIAGALRGNRRLRLTHRAPARGAPSTRTVDPYFLVNHRGGWYLMAHCHQAGDIRTFAVSRIERAETLNETFDFPEGLASDRVLGDRLGIIDGGRERSARIGFSPACAPYIQERDWHPAQRLTRRRDGGVVLSFPTRHLREVKDWVLSWGDGATALAPPERVRMVAGDLRRALAAYAKA